MDVSEPISRAKRRVREADDKAVAQRSLFGLGRGRDAKAKHKRPVGWFYLKGYMRTLVIRCFSRFFVVVNIYHVV